MVFFLTEYDVVMAQTSEEKVLREISGKGPGWAFSQRDFARLASRGAIDTALHRLLAKGTIRRVMRGIYDHPRHSDLLDTDMSPDIDQVARALARKFGWRTQPSGPTALNLLGLSTQVPASHIFLSDGPDRSYAIDGTILTFKHTALKEAGFRHRESALIVQALKSLGPDRIKPRVVARIRQWLDPDLREKILADTVTASEWVYAAIREICTEAGRG
jgi:hypothetical protein